MKNKIIGIYDINDYEIKESEEDKLRLLIKNYINENELVIIADYGHGLLTSGVINYITDNAKYLCVNTQLNSANIGFHTISKYKKK